MDTAVDASEASTSSCESTMATWRDSGYRSPKRQPVGALLHVPGVLLEVAKEHSGNAYAQLVAWSAK
jgi:hypothetical protein